MKTKINQFKEDNLYNPPTEATLKMLSRLAVIAVITIAPFAIYSLTSKNYLLGLSTSIIIAIFSFNAWTTIVHKAYFPRINFWLLAPAIIFFLHELIQHYGLNTIIWSYPAILCFYCMLPEGRAHIANAFLFLIIISCTVINIDLFSAIPAIASMLLVFILSGLFTNVINKQQKSLQELAIRDPLTSLLNRTSLKETLEQAIEQSMRAEIPMSIAIFDLDHFKKINDLHGHEKGDRVLQDVSKIFQERCRKVDRIFRLGGEEFLVFLYNTNNSNAIKIAEELRSLMEDMSTIDDIKITSSAGIATLSQGEDWREWMNRADDKQYQAKLLGRNRIVS